MKSFYCIFCYTVMYFADRWELAGGVGDLALLLEVLRNLGRVASFVLVCGLFLLTLHKIFGFVHFGLARSADVR